MVRKLYMKVLMALCFTLAKKQMYYNIEFNQKRTINLSLINRLHIRKS